MFVIPTDSQITNQHEHLMKTLYYMTLNNMNRAKSLYRPYQNKPARQGRFYLVKLDNGQKPEVHTSSNVFNLLEIVNSRPFNNWFITQNTIRGFHRSATLYAKNGKPYNNTRIITGFYLDFDVMNNGLDMNKFRKDLPNILSECGINPTAIIKSGHGYHVIILLNNGIPVNSFKISNLWGMIQDALIKRVAKECFKRYGKPVIDSSVSDITRVLRVIGSHNMKDPSKPILVTIKYLNLFNRPSLKEMRHNWVHIYNHNQKQSNGNCQKQRQKSNSRQSHHAANRNAYTLYKSRRHDIFKTAELRKGHSQTNESIKGCREFSLFYYAINSVMVMPDNKIAKGLNELNDTFSIPLPKSEVEHVINELTKIKNKIVLAHKMMKHHKKYWKLPGFPKGYVPTNKQIIVNLHITQSEQRHMKTLINNTEYHRRYIKRRLIRKFIRKIQRAKRNHQRQIHKQIELNNKIKRQNQHHQKVARRNAKIMSLHNRGMSLRQIAMHVNIGKSAVSNVIHKGVQSKHKKSVLTSMRSTTPEPSMAYKCNVLDIIRLLNACSLSSSLMLVNMMFSRHMLTRDTGSGVHIRSGH